MCEVVAVKIWSSHLEKRNMAWFFSTLNIFTKVETLADSALAASGGKLQI